jgi:uncharacterized membrane protein
MAKQKKIVNKKEDDRKLFAFLATFLSIIGFIIALVIKKEDKYVMFYAKQSLVVFIVALICSIISSLFMHMLFIGSIIATAINIIVAILWITSWIYALSGEEKEVPVIGIYARKISL